MTTAVIRSVAWCVGHLTRFNSTLSEPKKASGPVFFVVFSDMGIF